MDDAKDPFVYVSKQNVLRFRDLLRSEIDPTRLSDLQRVLVDEENRLGSNYERLEDIDREIAKADQRIELQRTLVANIEREGRDATAAKALLEPLSEAQRTVVTETKGILAGQRVVRGREGECITTDSSKISVPRTLIYRKVPDCKLLQLSCSGHYRTVWSNGTFIASISCTAVEIVIDSAHPVRVPRSSRACLRHRCASSRARRDRRSPEVGRWRRQHRRRRRSVCPGGQHG